MENKNLLNRVIYPAILAFSLVALINMRSYDRAEYNLYYEKPKERFVLDDWGTPRDWYENLIKIIGIPGRELRYATWDPKKKERLTREILKYQLGWNHKNNYGKFLRKRVRIMNAKNQKNSK